MLARERYGQIFWTDRSASEPELADYALRLAATVANTTISERGFSSLERCQTRLRSNLTIERLDELVFINMNAKLLEAEDYRTTTKRQRLGID